MTNPITISASIQATPSKVWDYYTLPNHITQWNFADPSWHCPSASNDMRVGGKYAARMEAKDGSFGFTFEATYEQIDLGKSFSYVMPDDRKVVVSLKPEANYTLITVAFDPENENPLELQRGGWQAILDNFKKYVESN